MDKQHKKKQEKKEELEANNNKQVEENSSAANESNNNKDYDALWDKYVRLCAEFDNARKRWQREQQEIVKFAAERIIREILTIVDELEQALKTMRENNIDQKIIQGIELIQNNIMALLKRYGVEPIKAKGDKFDPLCHEIVYQKPVQGIKEHTVIEEVQRGYRMADKVLRTAKVVIASAGKENLQEQNQEQNIEDAASSLAEEINQEVSQAESIIKESNNNKEQ